MANWNIYGWAGTFALLAFGCGARSADIAESNTNWLGACESTADCSDGMACACGVCTKNCDDNPCPARLECLAECGSGGSCQKSCADDDGCMALDENAECEQGVCVVPGGLSTSAVNAAPGAAPTMTYDPGDGTGCRVAYVNYAPNTVVPGDECGYTTCRCAGSGELLDCGGTELACEFDGVDQLRACDEMFPDGQVRSDDIDIVRGFVVGNVLTVEVGHAGGCESHDYAICHRPAADPGSPEGQEIVFIHDAHDDGCEAYLQQSLRFNLTPMGDRYIADHGVSGGSIVTNYGVYTFGDLTCEERQQAAASTVSQFEDTLDKNCVEDEDCNFWYVSSSCIEDCSIAARSDAALVVEQLLENLDQGPCAGYQGTCGRVSLTCGARVAVCRNGACELGAR